MLRNDQPSHHKRSIEHIFRRHDHVDPSTPSLQSQDTTRKEDGPRLHLLHWGVYCMYQDPCSHPSFLLLSSVPDKALDNPIADIPQQIFAAAKNKYESFTHPFAPTWTIWYLREAFTAMLCVNLPLTRPFFQHIFRLKDWTTQRTEISYIYDTHSRTNAFRLRGNSTTTVTGGDSGRVSGERSRVEEEYVVERVFGEGVIMVRRQTDVTVESGRRVSDASILELEHGKGENQPGYPGRETSNNKAGLGA